MKYRQSICIFILAFLPFSLLAQRTYNSHSVLASGEWYKIAVEQSGVYKIDPAFLRSLGITTNNIQTRSVRIYGKGGGPLPEANAAAVSDDLPELALQSVDDGDGIFNGNDYILFYAEGADRWVKDSVNRRFSHVANIYESRAYYFLTIGGQSVQVPLQSPPSPATISVTSFSNRMFHELDTVNFLSSGKQWYGEEFSAAPGVPLMRTFVLGLQQPVAGERADLRSGCISRSFSNAATFQLTAGNQSVATHNFTAVGSSNLDVYARESEVSASFDPSAGNLTYTYAVGAAGSQGWLNWFEINYRSNLVLPVTGQLLFRDWNSVGNNAIAVYSLKEANASVQVWDVTEPLRPLQMRTVVAGTALEFRNDASRLREYAAINSALAKTPLASGKISNQDLHALPTANLLIVTTPALLNQAGKIARFHQNRNQLASHVINIAEVFNEFASGAADPTALRNLVRMFFDRANGDTNLSPKYLLLLGDATYDYKAARATPNAFVPAYESNSSLDPLSTYTSDDYFGFLQDSEDINHSDFKTLDIGIGRIPARTVAEAENYIAKLNRYVDTASLGPWRNEMTLVADDEDFNLHLHDAEAIAGLAAATNPGFHQNKIYLDAFPQQSNSSGSRYPLVNSGIKERIDNGTLIWNYSGHGGFRRLAEEVVLDADVLDTWNNANRLPLFITATCDFAPFDNPANFSLGENALLRPSTGAIALMTTTRLVFASSNRIINSNYLQSALSRNANGIYPSLGEAVKRAKNNPATNRSEVLNNLKFTLLGDPALTLNFPRYQVLTDSINGLSVTNSSAQISALQTCTLAGSVRDGAGRIMTEFNGSVYTNVYDKPDSVATLVNDPQSLAERFPQQQRLLYKGLTDVRNGRFSLRFIVPKDLDYKAGTGKIIYYATNGNEDANGSFTSLEISGTRPPIADLTGPAIRAFLGSENFKDGGTTGPSPLLLLELKDSSGINITGSAIGHDITAIIDDDPAKRYVLNNYFLPVLNSSTTGNISFSIPILPAGNRKLRIRAWDIVNNSSELLLNFVVTEDFSIIRLNSYPNPFQKNVTISFTHDLDPQQIELQVEIFTSSGLHVKSLRNTINNMNSRSSELVWDGKNENGMPVAPGLYIYRIMVKNAKGLVKSKTGKLVRLR